jgi:hypothetical protein
VIAMRLRPSYLLPLAILAPSAGYAALGEVPAPSEIRLSQDEIDKVLDEAARRREHPQPSAENPKRQVHGEVGFSVGTGGYRSAYGTAIVPFDDEGFAIFSLDSSDFGSSFRNFDRRQRNR